MTLKSTATAQALGEVILLLKEFVAERKRLSDYDASASAINTVADAVLMLAEFQLAMLNDLTADRASSTEPPAAP